MSYKTGGHLIIRDLLYVQHLQYKKIPEFFLNSILSEIVGTSAIETIDKIYYVIDTNNVCMFIKICNYPYFYSENPKLVLDFCRYINIHVIKGIQMTLIFQLNSELNLQEYSVIEYGKRRTFYTYFYFPHQIKRCIRIDLYHVELLS